MALDLGCSKCRFPGFMTQLLKVTHRPCCSLRNYYFLFISQHKKKCLISPKMQQLTPKQLRWIYSITGNWKDKYFLFWTAPLGMVEPSNRAEYSQRLIHIFRLHSGWIRKLEIHTSLSQKNLSGWRSPSDVPLWLHFTKINMFMENNVQDLTVFLINFHETCRYVSTFCSRKCNTWAQTCWMCTLYICISDDITCCTGNRTLHRQSKQSVNFQLPTQNKCSVMNKEKNMKSHFHGWMDVAQQSDSIRV